MTYAQIVALPLQTSARLIRAEDTGVTYHIAAGQTGAAANSFPLNQDDLQLLLAAEALENRVALELDDGDGNLPTQGFVLADTGNVSKDAGVISENSSGNIIKHDGVSDGDDLPYLEYGWRLSGYQEITAPQNQAGVNRELGRISIPASLAVNGQAFMIVGSISVEHGAATNTPAYVIGFVPAGVAATPDMGVGYINNITNQSQTFPAFRMRMVLYGGVSTYALTPDVAPVGILLSGNSAATAQINLSQLAYQGNLSEEGPVNASQDLILYYSCGATASAPASKVTVNLHIYPL